MDISLRSSLTAGVSLTAATALAFAPLAIPPDHHSVTIPHVAVPELRLAVSPADIEVFIADLQTVLDGATTTAAEVAGIPGQNLIGVVDNIVALIDGVFAGLIDATANQTLVASLTILKTLSVDAFAKLGENLRLINPVITTTVTQVGDLLSSALTGSLQNILGATVKVGADPVSLANYAGLLTAGVASGQLLVGNGLKAVQALGDGLFDIAGIALSEVTFQLNNAAGGISALLTQLGDASDNAVVQAVLGAVRGFAIAPAVAVFNLGSGVAGAVLTTAHTGFDVVFDAATGLVGGATTEVSPGLTDNGVRLTLIASGEADSETAHIADDPAPLTVEPAVAEEVQPMPVTSTDEKADEPSGEVVAEADDAVVDNAVVDDAVVEEAPAEDAPEEDSAESDAIAQEVTHEAADQDSVTDKTAGKGAAPGKRSGGTATDADDKANSSDAAR